MGSYHIGNVRIASLEDVPNILSIFQQCDPYFFSGNQPNPIALLDVIEWVENATHERPFFMLERNGVSVGWCSLEPFYGLPEFDSALEVSLYVIPEWQGKGVGQELMHYIETQQTNIGFTHLVSYIYANNSNSLRFFKRQHFQQWGRLPNIACRNNQREDVFLYGKHYHSDS